MKFIPPFSASLLFLIGTIFPLQAATIFGESGKQAATASDNSARAEEKNDTDGRRISVPGSADEASTDGDPQTRQDSLVKVEEEDPSTKHSSSSAAGGGAAISPSTDSSASAGSQEHALASEASFQGHKIADVPLGKTAPLYRLGPNGWEIQDSETKEWKSTSKFVEQDSFKSAGSIDELSKLDAFIPFIDHENRSENIDKRREAYEQELKQQLKNPSPQSENRIFTLQLLIEVLKTASAYQNDMVAHLSGNHFSPDPRISVLQISHRVQSALKLNESPNQVERITHQIESDHQSLVFYQIALDAVEQHIGALQPDEELPTYLQEARLGIQAAITHIRDLMISEKDYAKLLSPPYETVDEKNQAARNALALTCRRETLLAEEKYLVSFAKIVHADPDLSPQILRQYESEARHHAETEAQQPQPRQQAIDWFTQSANLFQRSSTCIASGEGPGIRLFNRGKYLYFAAKEARQPQSRQQVINLFTQSADLLQQPDAVFQSPDLNFPYIPGATFYFAAKEAQQTQPRQQVINWFISSEKLMQQSIASFEAGNNNLGGACIDASRTFVSLALEARRLQPRQEIINEFLNRAERDLFIISLLGIAKAHELAKKTHELDANLSCTIM